MSRRNTPTKTHRPANGQVSAAIADDIDELLGEIPPEEAAPAAEEIAPPPRVAPPPVRITRVEIEAPLAQYRPEVRQFSHVELRLTPAEGRIVRQLFDGLREGHEQLANGRHIDSAADCFRWLLDKLAQRYEIATS